MQKKNPFLGIDKTGSFYTSSLFNDGRRFESAYEAAQYYNKDENEYDWEGFYKTNPEYRKVRKNEKK